METTTLPLKGAAQTTKALDVKKNGKATGELAGLRIQPVPRLRATIRVVGTTPLIVHHFSEKAKKMMRDKQMKTARTAREAKVPFDEFVGSLYVLPGKKLPSKKLSVGQAWPYVADTFYVPASGIKNAVVSAGPIVSLPKTTLRAALFVLGDRIPITYKRLTMREDMVRVGKFPNRSADIRYRGEFQDWSLMLNIEFNCNLISLEELVNLIDHSGFSIGLHEWRPERNGEFGRFMVDRKGKHGISGD